MKALINSIQNPLTGVIVVISSPIALISYKHIRDLQEKEKYTFAPHVHRPAVIPRPPKARRYHGAPIFGSYDVENSFLNYFKLLIFMNKNNYYLIFKFYDDFSKRVLFQRLLQVSAILQSFCKYTQPQVAQ